MDIPRVVARYRDGHIRVLLNALFTLAGGYTHVDREFIEGLLPQINKEHSARMAAQEAYMIGHGVAISGDLSDALKPAQVIGFDGEAFHMEGPVSPYHPIEIIG